MEYSGLRQTLDRLQAALEVIEREVSEAAHQKPVDFIDLGRTIRWAKGECARAIASNLEQSVLTATGLNLESLVRPITRKFGEPDADLRERFLNRLGD